MNNNTIEQNIVNNNGEQSNEQPKLRMPQIFIGKNYDKLINKKFSFAGFFFGGIYFMYRKMYLIGIILYVLTVLLTMLLPKYIDNLIILAGIYLIISIIIGVVTNKIYRNHVEKKLNKIKAKNLSYDQSAAICKKQGGTNLLLAIVICIIIGLLPNLLFSKIDTNNENKDENNNSNTNENINNDNDVVSPDESKDNYELLMSYVGTYQMNDNRIRISLGIDGLTVEIRGNTWESMDVEVNGDGTITYENTFFDDTVKLNIEKTISGISVEYSTTDEDNIDNNVSGEYDKVYYATKGWTGIYINGDINVVLNEFEDELTIYVCQTEGYSITAISVYTEEYNIDRATYISDSFGETENLVIEKTEDKITLTASSTKDDSFFNNISGTYTKSS